MWRSNRMDINKWLGMFVCGMFTDIRFVNRQRQPGFFQAAAIL